MDRGSILADPEILRIVSEDFIPVAADVWILQRTHDAEGEFFWSVADQGHNADRGRNETRQGLYMFAADGTFLASCNSRRVDYTLRILREALERFEALPVEVDDLSPDPRWANRVPPEGGLVLDVFARVMLPADSEDRGSTMNDASIGRDHMWLRESEWRELISDEGPVDQDVAMRLARFHLIDDVRGEPPMWDREEVRSIDLARRRVDGGFELEGRAHLEADNRGYEAALRGFIGVSEGRITRFEIVVRGEHWGHGPYNREPPPGRYPLVIAAVLADGGIDDTVAPEGYWGEEYWNP